jgi:uncharacterized protein YbjT (DUF2867 family)
MEKRTALLFGATGLVGGCLLDALIHDDRYNKITVFTRKSLQTISPKVEEVITDFRDLNLLGSRMNDGDWFCCIGTTIKKAGTRERFRYVDFGIPVALAEIAAKKLTGHFIVVSSVGANAESSNFYLRTKGEMEQSLIRLLKNTIIAVRPSMLLGKRPEIRFGEEAGKRIMKIVGPLMVGRLSRYKGIEASDVARAMIELAVKGTDQQVIESEELHILSKSYRV